VDLAGYDPHLDNKEDNYELGSEIAQHCQAYGSGLYGAEAGQPAEFMIQVCDPNGQQLKTGGLLFTATLCDDTCLYHIGLHDHNNGTLSAFFVISRPGHYELSLLLNDEHHIYGSPFTVEVLPSQTHPASCVAYGECFVKGLVPEVQSTFTIIAMDSYGNRKQRGGDPFEVGVMGPVKLIGLEDKGDGSYECTLEASYLRDQPYVTSSSISVIVTLHGKPIQGSPFRPSIDMTASRPLNQSNPNTQNTTSSGAPQNPSSRSNPSNQTAPTSTSAAQRQQQRSERESDVPPRPPLIIPPGTNKLEAARMRALEAAKELPSTPQDLVARAMQEKNGNDSSGSNQNPRQRNPPVPSTTSLNRSGFLSSLLYLLPSLLFSPLSSPDIFA
jgi:hypothetical protein